MTNTTISICQAIGIILNLNPVELLILVQECEDCSALLSLLSELVLGDLQITLRV